MRESKALAVFEPGSFMRRFFRNFDHFFDTRNGYPYPFRSDLGEFAWWPELELTERDHRLYARLDVPGMKKDELAITVDDGTLTVSGERKKESEEKKADWFSTERLYGKFSRTIALPEGVDAAAITATFANGVLELKMPLPAKIEPKPRTITIGEGDTGKAEAKAA
jgi:HSP20 family protein